MHAPRVLAGKLQPLWLVHWKRVNVCPQGNHGLPAANSRHDTRLGVRVRVGHPQVVQVLPYAGAGVVFLIHQLWELVQLPADLLQPGLQGVCCSLELADVHGISSSCDAAEDSHCQERPQYRVHSGPIKAARGLGR
jgi:hypothetical protein